MSAIARSAHPLAGQGQGEGKILLLNIYPCPAGAPAPTPAKKNSGNLCAKAGAFAEQSITYLGQVCADILDDSVNPIEFRSRQASKKSI